MSYLFVLSYIYIYRDRERIYMHKKLSKFAFKNTRI